MKKVITDKEFEDFIKYLNQAVNDFEIKHECSIFLLAKRPKDNYKDNFLGYRLTAWKSID